MLIFSRCILKVRLNRKTNSFEDPCCDFFLSQDFLTSKSIRISFIKKLLSLREINQQNISYWFLWSAKCIIKWRKNIRKRMIFRKTHFQIIIYKAIRKFHKMNFHQKIIIFHLSQMNNKFIIFFNTLAGAKYFDSRYWEITID